MRSLAMAAICGIVTSPALAATFFGPSPYLSSADSPLLGSLGLVIEDFEDNLFNVPGVTSTPGGSVVFGSIVDSVDGDDGAIDGSGAGGHSYFGGGSPGFTFTFDAAILGSLPTRAGIVWTDGLNDIFFEAFDEFGVSLGSLTGTHADASFSSGTAEDRFYGIEHAGGISAIHIHSSPSAGLEVDHLQFGWIPTPSTLALVGLSGLVASRRRRI